MCMGETFFVIVVIIIITVIIIIVLITVIIIVTFIVCQKYCSNLFHHMLHHEYQSSISISLHNHVTAYNYTSLFLVTGVPHARWQWLWQRPRLAANQHDESSKKQWIIVFEKTIASPFRTSEQSAQSKLHLGLQLSVHSTPKIPNTTSERLYNFPTKIAFQTLGCIHNV